MSTDYNVTADVADDYTSRVNEVVHPVAVAVVAAEPLRIVQHPTADLTTGSVTVSAGQVQQVAGAAPFRDILHIANKGPGNVYLGPAPDTLTESGGYWLKEGATQKIRSRHAVYVLGDQALTQPAVVHWFAEYVDG